MPCNKIANNIFQTNDDLFTNPTTMFLVQCDDCIQDSLLACPKGITIQFPNTLELVCGCFVAPILFGQYQSNSLNPKKKMTSLTSMIQRPIAHQKLNNHGGIG